MATEPRVVSAESLPLNLNDNRAPLWWGMWGLIAIEATLFAALLVSYYYLRHSAPEWPLGGIEEPELLLPTVNTAIILVSSVPVAWADRGIRRGLRTRLAAGWSVAVILGLAFLAIKYVEMSSLAYRWDTNAYGSIVWTIIGFHTAHVMALMLKTVVVLTLALRGYFTESRNVGVQINGLYWHFVVAVWIPIYLTIYISPRLL
ncbi:MAG: heme-copper oxidase subunit III [Anaerolineae bacterium]|nr:heme-copper oxidase subunit III [Anaerolineae bacterium]